MAAPFSDTLRAALRDAPLDFQNVCAQAKVSKATAQRFLSGERSMRLDLADRLAAVLGLEVATRPREQVNKHGQRVLHLLGPAKSHHFANRYQIECSHCDHRYTALSCDLWQRRCPHCQAGKGGSK